MHQLQGGTVAGGDPYQRGGELDARFICVHCGCAAPLLRPARRRYDPCRQRFRKSRRSGTGTFWTTACLRQATRASLTHRLT